MTTENNDNSVNSRFAAPAATAEDVLKEQTLGLVQLSDFRKRRAEAYNDSDLPSGSASPISAAEAGSTNPMKKRKKPTTKPRLQLGDDDEEDSASSAPVVKPKLGVKSKARLQAEDSTATTPENSDTPARRLAPKAGLNFAPKITTKAAAHKEAEERKRLAAEYVETQARVKATDVVVPFTFFDGTNIPGGKCRIQKSDQIWLLLDKARKVGAELGVGGDKSKKEWARISVDDLMLVKDELIIPHHYDLYHFIINKRTGYKSIPLFPYSDQPTTATPLTLDQDNGSTTNTKTYNPLSTSGDRSKAAALPPQHPNEVLEGFNDDPMVTKVVDRRWYEKNKHIFPMSMWEDYDAAKDYKTAIRKDGQGNAFFF